MLKQKSMMTLFSSFILSQTLLFSAAAQAEDLNVMLNESQTSVAQPTGNYRSKYFMSPLSNQVCTSALETLSRVGANQTKYAQLDALIEAFSVECGISQNDPTIDFPAVAFKFEDTNLFVLWDGQSITINQQAEATIEFTMPPSFNNIITIKKADVNPKKENRLFTRITQKLDGVRDHLKMIYDQGDTRLILSGYAYHDRGTYTADKVAQLNERAWGVGLERVIINEKGNRESVFAMIFLDSHGDPEPSVGYNWQKGFRVSKSIKAYLGASAGLTMRSDLTVKGVPVPVPYVFPTAGLSIGKIDIQGVLIPKLGGGINHGNVLFLFASVPLDK